MIDFTLKNTEGRSNNKVIKPTISLIREVLSLLGYYNGVWGLTFIEQAKNRSDKKWWPLRCGPNSIIVRTKPGNNETCWEIALIPPKGNDLNKIFDQFKQIDSQKIKLLRGGVGGSNINEILNIAKTIIPASSNKPTVSIQKAIETIVEFGPKALRSNIAPKAHELAVEQAKTEVENSIAKTTAAFKIVTEVQKFDDYKFNLALQTTANVEDKNTIAHAIVALIYFTKLNTKQEDIDVICKKDGLSKFLIEKLELGKIYNFCNHELGHQNADRAGAANAKTLLNTLCSQGYLSRDIKLPTRVEVAKKPNVTGYVIEPKSIKLINSYRSYLPSEIVRYIDVYNDEPKIDEQKIKETMRQAQTVVPVVVPVVQPTEILPTDTLGIIETKVEQIRPLMDEHDKLETAIGEFEQLRIVAKQNYESEEIINLGLKTRTTDLKNQLDKLTKQLESSSAKLDSLLQEEDYISTEVIVNQNKLQKIKQSLQDLLR